MIITYTDKSKIRIKFVIRRGKAHAGNKNFNLANRDLIRVLKLRPQDESVKKELMSLKKVCIMRIPVKLLENIFLKSNSFRKMC